MNLRVFFNLLVLCCLLLALAGCASSPRSGQGAETADATVSAAAAPDPNKPHLFFSGGDIQQVRGAALGAAVTQGWKVEETAGESLILQRNLDSTAAEALAPGASRGPLPPVVEVRADFFPRPGGVETQLGAQVITQRGTSKETRQDYTDAYRNELSHSLATLQNAWHEAGPRIAKALPPTGGFQDSRNPEGQVADTPASSSFDSGYADNSATGQNDAEPLTSSPVAAAEFETETETEDKPQVSSAATWALPAGAAATAATAAAVAQARASALPPGSAQAATVKAGPAPVVSLAPTANPRLSQRPAPAPLPRTASTTPQMGLAKGGNGISSAARGDQRVLISLPTGKAGKAEVTSPVQATSTTTKTKMPSGSAATVATAAKPATRTTASATTAPAGNKKATSAASKTPAPASVTSTKVPATKIVSATGNKTAKPTATPASPSTAGQAPGKTTPVKQQPAKPATTGTKTASALGTTAAGTNSPKSAANASKTNSANKTTGTTAGAKKAVSSKGN